MQILFKKFQVKTCFLNKILKNLNKKLTKEPSKHSPWWRRTEDVLKTSSRSLQCNIVLSFKTSWRHNCKMFCKNVLKTSWKTSWERLEDVLGRRIANTSWRRLEGVFKRSWKRKVLLWRRLEDVLKTSWKTRNVCCNGCDLSGSGNLKSALP